MPPLSKYEIFDRSRLEIKALGERKNDLEIGHWLQLGDPTPEFKHADLPQVAARKATLHDARNTTQARKPP